MLQPFEGLIDTASLSVIPSSSCLSAPPVSASRGVSHYPSMLLFLITMGPLEILYDVLISKYIDWYQFHIGS